MDVVVDHTAVPPFRVDVVAALDVLAECARSRPGGPGATQHLLDVALARLGLTSADLAAAPHRATAGGASGVAAGRGVTLGALVALRAADRAERRGATWAQSVEAAQDDVARLLELVPAALVRSAFTRSVASADRDLP